MQGERVHQRPEAQPARALRYAARNTLGEGAMPSGVA